MLRKYPHFKISNGNISWKQEIVPYPKIVDKYLISQKYKSKQISSIRKNYDPQASYIQHTAKYFTIYLIFKVLRKHLTVRRLYVCKLTLRCSLQEYSIRRISSESSSASPFSILLSHCMYGCDPFSAGTVFTILLTMAKSAGINCSEMENKFLIVL